MQGYFCVAHFKNITELNEVILIFIPMFQMKKSKFQFIMEQSKLI